MKLAKVTLLAATIMITASVTTDVVFAQCSMCKTALVNSAEGQRLASGFNSGILFLLCVPFMIAGTIALLIFNAQRRVRPVA